MLKLINVINYFAPIKGGIISQFADGVFAKLSQLLAPGGSVYPYSQLFLGTYPPA